MGYYRVGELVRRVWLTGVYWYKRNRVYYRVGALVRRVWLTGVYCYKRDRGYYLTNRFHVAVRLFSNRSQMTSKCGKNKKVAHEA